MPFNLIIPPGKEDHIIDTIRSFDINTVKVKTALKYVQGRGITADLFGIIAELTNLNYDKIESVFITRDYSFECFRKSYYSDHYLVNIVDEFSEFQGFSELKFTVGVQIQVLIGMARIENILEYNVSSKIGLYRKIVKFFRNNNGPDQSFPENVGPTNLFNKLRELSIIKPENTNPPFNLDLSNCIEDSNITDENLVESETYSLEPISYLYLIEETTTEYFNDSGNICAYKYSFLNFGMSRNIKERYGNRGYKLLRLYRGHTAVITEIENILKSSFQFKMRFDRFNRRTKEHIDDSSLFDKLIELLTSEAKERGLDDVLEEHKSSIAKDIALKPSHAKLLNT